LRLQPHFIESFFLNAFRRLGGSVFERESRRYEITHVVFFKASPYDPTTRTGGAVAAVNPASPDFVQGGAKAGVLAQFQWAHAPTEIAFRCFPGFVDRADDRHRFTERIIPGASILCVQSGPTTITSGRCCRELRFEGLQRAFGSSRWHSIAQDTGRHGCAERKTRSCALMPAENN
jgi:hypothetical protein